MQPIRRKLLKTLAATSALASLPAISLAAKQPKVGRVVIIGGGFAGATAAHYLALWSPDIEVVMIERETQFISCPQSNLVLSGHRSIADLSHDYSNLSKLGIHHLQATVSAIDTENQRVQIETGEKICYDRLIIAPGVDMDYSSLPMLTQNVVDSRVPHAWKAGAQTQLLRDQLTALPDGGVVVMTIPSTPFKCPPGPYERACQIAWYLKHHRPKSKLIILDANADVVSKKALFKGEWSSQYADWIEYLPANALLDVNIDTLTVETEFDEVKADVLNVIPAQKAGKVADLAGVVNVDRRWCEVDFRTYESTQVEKVHVIGDAVASTMPKSGHVANGQAKVCAAAVIALMKDQAVVDTPIIGNTCYSFVDGERVGHVAAVFRYDEASQQMKPMPGGGVSPEATRQDAQYANAWARNIWADIVG